MSIRLTLTIMGLNWPQLVAQGRARDIGIAWTEEEHALLQAMIADGASRTDAAEMLRGGAKRKDLEKEAKRLDVPFSDEAPDSALASAVKAKKPKAKAKGKKK